MLQPNGSTVWPQPTRFPSGVGTAFPSDPLQNLAVPDPTKLSYVFLDALDGLGDIAATTPNSFTKTTVGTGTYAIGDVTGMFGALVMTTTTSSSDQNSAQSKGRVAAADNAKRLQFACRLSVDSLTSVAWVVGLTTSDTTPIGASGTPEAGFSDGIVFTKDDGAANFRIAVRSGSATIVSDSTGLGSQVAATPTNLAFDYNPINRELRYWVDGVQKGTLVVTTFPATALVLQASVITRSAAARVLNIDYLLSSQERT